jgi:hypothetical protein
MKVLDTCFLHFITKTLLELTNGAAYEKTITSSSLRVAQRIEKFLAKDLDTIFAKFTRRATNLELR